MLDVTCADRHDQGLRFIHGHHVAHRYVQHGVYYYDVDVEISIGIA